MNRRMLQHKNICNRCGLREIPREVYFDSRGICNLCVLYLNNIQPLLFKQQKLGLDYLAKITKDDQLYNEINVPISGGVDSSFTAHLAKKYFDVVNLIHVDTGWNTSQAVRNINAIANSPGFTYRSIVLPWSGQQKMYAAAIRHGINNLDIIQDNAIFAALNQYSKNNNIPFWFGQNLRTEFVHFQNWHESYRDILLLWYLKILSGSWSYKILPLNSRLLKKKHRPLDYINYNKDEAMKILSDEYGYEKYEEKHSESLFTKFFQNVYAPQKGLIKRLQHEANLAIVGDREKLPKDLHLELTQLSRSELFFVFRKLKIEDQLLNNWPEKSLSARVISMNHLFRIYRKIKK